MHEVNKAESLALTQSTACDYIRFFLYFLRADDGAFVLIESADEVGPRAGGGGRDEDQDEVLTLEAARGPSEAPPDAGLDPTGRWLVDATVAYDGGLFDTSLAVEDRRNRRDDRRQADRGARGARGSGGSFP